MVFVLIGLSAQPVWIGLIFAYFIGFKLEVTPITGHADFFDPSQEHSGPMQMAYHMLLPSSKFTILFAALYVRLIRADVMETMNKDFIRAERAKDSPRAPGDPLAHPPGRHAADRHDPRDGHRGPRLAAADVFTESNLCSLPGLGRQVLQS